MDPWVFAPLCVATPKDDEVGVSPTNGEPAMIAKNISPIPAEQTDGASWI